MLRAHSRFPKTIPPLPAQAPKMLANIVILLAGALGCIFSYFIFLTDVFSSTGAAKLVICIMSLFIIYGKTQISRALYDCYLIHSASWNKGPTISLSCHSLMEDSRIFSRPFPPATILTCLSKVIWGPPMPQTLPSAFLNFLFLPTHIQASPKSRNVTS